MRVSEILERIAGIKFIGDLDSEVDHPLALNDIISQKKFLTWSNEKNLSKMSHLRDGTIVVPSSALNLPHHDSLNLIVTDNPRKIFQEILLNFFYHRENWGISKTAIIYEGVVIGAEVNLGNNVIVEKGCTIGTGTTIGHNTVIHKNTIIGDNVTIGSNCTIGGVGFGYEKDDSGQFQLIPHLGNVVIKNNVEVGNNTCIDRAVLGSTILNANSKIDNLVHIAHGVVVGENSMIIANAMVAGSVRIGKNVWVAPSSSIKNGIALGDGSLVGLGAVVVKDVLEDSVVVGNPAKPLLKK